jgi:lipopolysaccharide transport system ATP-binding protein
LRISFNPAAKKILQLFKPFFVMSESVIEVEKISKRYVLGHQRAKGDGLRHAVETAVRRPIEWLRQQKRAALDEVEDFWALKNVSFEVKQGEVVGIIGRNGAGKSTLLKILSRITEPTKGKIQIAGRVASLLEVGTGFHPELTGRENIFLNGAILGMNRVEIRQKFDEIVAFSEVEKFLDTPVKRYSSGMYVRLAFAVAAHLEPEILIVDEVLAVGDAQFQKKCLGKIGQVAKGGRTILFVSHNMAVMRQLCTSGLLLRQGSVLKSGTINEVVDTYMAVGLHHTGVWIRTAALPTRSGIFFRSVKIFNHEGIVSGHLDVRHGFTAEIKVKANGTFSRGQIAIRVTNHDGFVVLTTCNSDSAGDYTPVREGEHTFRVQLPGHLLAPGNYTLQIAAHVPQMELFDLLDNTLSICVEDTGSLRSVFRDERLGAVEPVLAWEDEVSS